MDNLEEMDKFLEKCNLNQEKNRKSEDTNHKNRNQNMHRNE